MISTERVRYHSRKGIQLFKGTEDEKRVELYNDIFCIQNDYHNNNNIEAVSAYTQRKSSETERLFQMIKGTQWRFERDIRVMMDKYYMNISHRFK